MDRRGGPRRGPRSRRCFARERRRRGWTRGGDGRASVPDGPSNRTRTRPSPPSAVGRAGQGVEKAGRGTAQVVRAGRRMGENGRPTRSGSGPAHRHRTESGGRTDLAPGKPTAGPVPGHSGPCGLATGLDPMDGGVRRLLDWGADAAPDVLGGNGRRPPGPCGGRVADRSGRRLAGAVPRGRPRGRSVEVDPQSRLVVPRRRSRCGSVLGRMDAERLGGVAGGGPG